MSNLFKAIVESGVGDVSVGADGGLYQTFVFAEEFPGFMGHFPGHPVLPAVVQMMAATCVASHGQSRVRDIKGVAQAKFLTPISPGMPVTVHARMLGPDAAEIRVMAADEPAAAFTLLFEKTA